MSNTRILESCSFDGGADLLDVVNDDGRLLSNTCDSSDTCGGVPVKIFGANRDASDEGA
jgi:hypothetical protein